MDNVIDSVMSKKADPTKKFVSEMESLVREEYLRRRLNSDQEARVPARRQIPIGHPLSDIYNTVMKDPGDGFSEYLNQYPDSYLAPTETDKVRLQRTRQTLKLNNSLSSEAGQNVAFGSEAMKRVNHNVLVSVARIWATHRFAFPVLGDKELDLIASGGGFRGKMFEVGAGTGYYASRLAARGTDIIATDIAPPATRNNKFFDSQFYDVKNMHARRAAWKYSDRAMIMMWPSYGCDWAEEALETYIMEGGKLFIYVGEGRNGCCATDAFFDLMSTQASLVWRHSIPRWPHIYDGMTVCMF